ncbi:MAG: hypothetical protein H6848_06845 [Caulobacterales bacterium]|nr:hypothetical protein [Caulobacterales bacterium]
MKRFERLTLKHSDKINEKETARRRDETIKRMLSTPPKPHAPLKSEKKPPKKKKAAKRKTKGKEPG